MFEFNVFNNKIPAKNIPFVEWPTINFSERPLLLNGSLHSCFMKIVFFFQSSCKILQAQLISNQKDSFHLRKISYKIKMSFVDMSFAKTKLVHFNLYQIFFYI